MKNIETKEKNKESDDVSTSQHSNQKLLKNKIILKNRILMNPQLQVESKLCYLL